jgi:hypothetical protein
MRLLIVPLLAVSAWAQDPASRACGGCHGEIYRKYTQSGMARSSGRVDLAMVREQAAGPPIGGMYRVAKGVLSFERGGVSGSRELKWFIGSGNIGRSYIFEVDGFLFQAPVSYYTSAGRWDVSPGYEGRTRVELGKPIEAPCLYCHASRAQLVAGTANRYGTPPFLDAGVSCERCHGTHPNIVNPAKLGPSRRDSICQQCHLTGAARVPRPGRSVATFRPGDRLSDHMSVLVWDRPPGISAATDHAEQLARSRCKIASGDKLWCGTCHDAHARPTSDSRSCRECHAQIGCKVAAAGADCVSCHMPKRPSREGAHVAFTDHTIARRPSPPSPDRRDGILRNFWPAAADERDLAIAYASMGRRYPDALEKLRAPDDLLLLAQLGQAYDAAGRADLAEAVYERVLRLDPANVAASNLAIYRARKGRVGEAIALWRGVFARHPEMASAGINLAIAQLDVGDRAGATATVQRLLRFHPDLDAARQLLQRVR